MFITATIATTVSVIPIHAGTSCTPTTGNVKRWIQTPNMHGIEAASTCPPSFSHQRRPRKSSIAPTVVATARRAGSRASRRRAGGTRATGR